MLPLYLVPVLRERHFGLLQGVANDSHATVCGPESISRFRNDFDAAFPQGESCADVSDRVIPYLETHILPHVKGNTARLMRSPTSVPVSRCLV